MNNTYAKKRNHAVGLLLAEIDDAADRDGITGVDPTNAEMNTVFQMLHPMDLRIAMMTMRQ